MLMVIMTLPGEPEDRLFMAGLYQTYSRLMYWTARNYIENEQDVADVVHDSVVRLMGKTALLRTLSRPELAGYIAATVRHAACNFLRDEQLHRQLTPLLWPEGTDHGEETMIARMDARALLLALGRKMTEEERLLLEGKFLLEKSDEELALQLNCKPDSLRMKLSRARRNLRAYQQQLEGGGDHD